MIVVCDIDGTIADISTRIAYAGKQPSEWVRRWFPKRFQHWLDLLQSDKSLMSDRPIPGMVRLLRCLDTQYTIVYLTGRSCEYRAVTKAWLEKNCFPEGHLIMRHISSFETAAELKERHMERIASGHSEVIIFDDDGDETCAEMYRRNGWTHLKAMKNK